MLYDTIAKERGFKDFDDMAKSKERGIGTPKALEIVRADQRVIDLQPEIEEYKRSRGNEPTRTMTDVRLPYAEAQDTDDKALAAGTLLPPAWLAQYKDRQQNLGSADAEYLLEHPDTAARMAETAKNLDPFKLPADATPDQVRAAYFKLFDPYQGGDAIITAEEWTKLGLELDRFTAGLTPVQAKSFEENQLAGKSKTVKDYKADMKVLKPYQEATDEFWLASREFFGPEYAGMSLDQFMAAKVKEYQDAGLNATYLADDPMVRLFNRYADPLRQQYLLDPEVDIRQAYWYGYKVHGILAQMMYKERYGLEVDIVEK